jgi:signal transduction histidine kinase
MSKKKVFLMFFIIPYIVFLIFSYSIYRLNNNFLKKSFEERTSANILHLGKIYKRALINIVKTEEKNSTNIIKNSFFNSKEAVYFAIRKAKDELIGWGTRYEGFLPVFDYYPERDISLRKIKTPVGVIFELNIRYKAKNRNNTLTLGIKQPYRYIAEKIYFRYLLILDILIALFSFLYYMKIVNYNESVINKEKHIKKEKKEKEYFKALSVLSLGISHELRNPLNILSLILEKLEISYGNHKINKDIEAGKKEIDRILRVINSLHLLVEEGDNTTKGTKWRTESFNLMDVIKESIESLEKKFITEIRICDKTKGETFINGNRELTIILLTNLIKNSCEASGDKGVVKVSLNKDENIFMEIKDTGGGFNYNFETENISLNSEKIGHLGIGLFIAKKIIEYHSWKLEIKNYELGSILKLYFGE